MKIYKSTFVLICISVATVVTLIVLFTTAFLLNNRNVGPNTNKAAVADCSILQTAYNDAVSDQNYRNTLYVNALDGLRKDCGEDPSGWDLLAANNCQAGNCTQRYDSNNCLPAYNNCVGKPDGYNSCIAKNESLTVCLTAADDQPDPDAARAYCEQTYGNQDCNALLNQCVSARNSCNQGGADQCNNEFQSCKAGVKSSCQSKADNVSTLYQNVQTAIQESASAKQAYETCMLNENYIPTPTVTPQPTSTTIPEPSATPTTVPQPTNITVANTNTPIPASTQVPSTSIPITSAIPTITTSIPASTTIRPSGTTVVVTTIAEKKYCDGYTTKLGCKCDAPLIPVVQTSDVPEKGWKASFTACDSLISPTPKTTIVTANSKCPNIGDIYNMNGTSDVCIGGNTSQSDLDNVCKNNWGLGENSAATKANKIIDTVSTLTLVCNCNSGYGVYDGTKKCITRQDFCDNKYGETNTLWNGDFCIPKTDKGCQGVYSNDNLKYDANYVYAVNETNRYGCYLPVSSQVFKGKIYSTPIDAEFGTTSNGDKYVIIPSNLPAGQHRIELFNSSNALLSTEYFDVPAVSAALDPNKKPASSTSLPSTGIFDFSTVIIPLVFISLTIILLKVKNRKKYE